MNFTGVSSGTEARHDTSYYSGSLVIVPVLFAGEGDSLIYQVELYDLGCESTNVRKVALQTFQKVLPGQKDSVWLSEGRLEWKRAQDRCVEAERHQLYQLQSESLHEICSIFRSLLSAPGGSGSPWDGPRSLVI